MTTALVVLPALKGEDPDDVRERLAESEALARAVEGVDPRSETVWMQRFLPNTLFGSGTVDRLGTRVEAEEIDLVLVNAPLSPVQQRNLERAWKTKVLDRTGLILEIFGARAQTREGVLQVDLAHLDYQKSRLVRSWTHLERQRGGAGFMGGPGERQIESDRRQIDDRIIVLRRQLEKVVKTRTLHRAARKKVPYPIVALVGYTNAGKSTLFNTLTAADVLAKDMLFATLDPTLRMLDLPSGRKAILSDTVGFISELPTQLVAAFRATLEEVLEADLIVHVRDIASARSDEQADDVNAVLADLGLSDVDRDAVLEVRNKIDLLDAQTRDVAATKARRTGALLTSAATGDGLDALLCTIDRSLYPAARRLDIAFGHRDGSMISWVYRHSHVIDRRDDEAGTHLSVDMTERELSQFVKAFPEARDRANLS